MNARLVAASGTLRKVFVVKANETRPLVAIEKERESRCSHLLHWEDFSPKEPAGLGVCVHV